MVSMRRTNLLLLLLSAFGFVWMPGAAFQVSSRHGSVRPFSASKEKTSNVRHIIMSRGTSRDSNDDDADKLLVEVGTKEYLEGFITSPIQDEVVTQRGSGLEQALKLGGSITAVLVVLILGFMSINGLI